MTGTAVPAKGFSAWFTGHKTQAYVGSAGVVAAIALFVRSKRNAAGAPAGGSAAPMSTAVPTTTADTVNSDAYNGIESQVLGLQSALLAAQNPAPVDPVAASRASAAGASLTAGAAGFGGDTTFTDPQGNQYAYVPAWSIAAPLIESGVTLYDQPTPGMAAAATANNGLIANLGDHTPLYTKTTAAH